MMQRTKISIPSDLMVFLIFCAFVISFLDLFDKTDVKHKRHIFTWKPWKQECFLFK